MNNQLKTSRSHSTADVKVRGDVAGQLVNSIIALYNDGGGTVAFDTGAASNFAVSTTHTLSGITTGQADAMLVGMYAGDHAGSYDNGGYTAPLVEVADDNPGDITIAIAIGTQAGAGASGDKSATASLSDDGGGVLVSVYASE